MVHVARDAVLGLDPVERCETLGRAVLDQQVREWCGRNDDTHLTVQPVIDLADHVQTEAYELAERLQIRTDLLNPSCVFRWCSRPARSCDHDHGALPSPRAARPATATSRRCAEVTTVSRRTPGGATTQDGWLVSAHTGSLVAWFEFPRAGQPLLVAYDTSAGRVLGCGSSLVRHDVGTGQAPVSDTEVQEDRLGDGPERTVLIGGETEGIIRITDGTDRNFSIEGGRVVPMGAGEMVAKDGLTGQRLAFDAPPAQPRQVAANEVANSGPTSIIVPEVG